MPARSLLPGKGTTLFSFPRDNAPYHHHKVRFCQQRIAGGVWEKSLPVCQSAGLPVRRFAGSPVGAGNGGVRSGVRMIPGMKKPPGLWLGGFLLSSVVGFWPGFGYLAYSTDRTSRSTVTRIWPGYSSSVSTLFRMSRASFAASSSLTFTGSTRIRISRPAWIA